ncbi:MAG TPA: DUF481 domain-containing protein [Longimicrobiales bacterium]|nr:DUF481 domain-containing protein [Longimicrobiales bacterium]
MLSTTTPRTLLACVTAALVCAATPALAQNADTFELDAELGASLFFGASSQAAVLVRSGLEWNSPSREFAASWGFDYGEAEDGDGNRFVNKRSWAFQTSADYLPGGRLSPFLFATAEGSYERQIDFRTSGGVGAKYRFVDNERTRVDFSLAALLERTDPRQPAGVDADVVSIGRWSARFRLRQAITDAVSFDLVSFYRPRMNDFDDHNWDVNASLQVALSSTLGVRFSVVNKYDSTAEARGARSNHDGRAYFSIVTALR